MFNWFWTIFSMGAPDLAQLETTEKQFPRLNKA